MLDDLEMIAFTKGWINQVRKEETLLLRTTLSFRTATGVHAAAVIKSYRKGDQRLADIVYSGVPAGEFGLEQVIEIGPMSGKSNVIYWLEKRGLEPSESRVNRIYERAKAASGVLEESEIMGLL
jgi:2-isopropylmalate synthase